MKYFSNKLSQTPKRALSFINKRYHQLVFKYHPKLSDSKVFCISPWIQLHAQTNGYVGPCCMASMNETNYLSDLNENPNLIDAWNSEKMRQLRLNMLKGEKSSICQNCYKYEELGNESERIKYNKDYIHYIDRVFKTDKTGSVGEEKVLLLDMRFSNKCNYKCRICDSSYSSLWYEDEQKLGKNPQLPSQKKMTISSDKEKFNDSYKEILSDVIKIHFAGGEPLIMEEHYQVLEDLIKINHSDVVLSYNTNFSTLKYKNVEVIEQWKFFKTVDVWASLDGMFERGDYMRKGQRWNKIEENILRFQKELPQGLLGINITVSLLNILHLPEFIKYLIEKLNIQPIRINLYLLFGPSYYSVIQLPNEIKEKAEAELVQFKNGYLSKIVNGNHLSAHIDTVLNYMNSEEGQQLEEFKYWTQKIDILRDEDFGKVFPELSKI
jgi:MoaA/NifB/PqqE/SkfB family radical SAM enzyme